MYLTELGLSPAQDWLSISADVAQAVTGVVAGIAGIRYLCQRRLRRVKLETYLLEQRKIAEKAKPRGDTAKSIANLMGHCSMTEAQILEAAFSSTKIKSWLTVDNDGFAGKLLFQFKDDAWEKVKDKNP